MAGNDIAVHRHQVGRRSPAAPALVAVGDLAGEGEGGAEQLVGVLHRAAEHEAADVAGGHDLAVHLEQVDHTRLESAVGAQQLVVAGGLVAEAEVLPHTHVLGPQRPHEHVVDEALRAAPG